MVKTNRSAQLSGMSVAALIGVAVGAYGLAFATQWGAAAILVALPCVLMLARVRTPRQAFYVGLVAGIGMYGPQLLFFWSVFGAVAMALWLVTGLPMAVFVLLLHLMRKRFGESWASWLTPVLWMGSSIFGVNVTT